MGMLGNPSPRFVVHQVTVVTKFDRFRAVLIDRHESGIMVERLETDTLYTTGTILFIPWHQVDHLVISTPEQNMRDEQALPTSGAV